jgi:iduronate 2-sulfatase
MSVGDHGYNIGELNLWCKMSVFESGVRVPFMIRAPGMSDAGLSSSSLAEAIDLMPTLIELATGIAPPSYCDGNSLAPLLKDPKATVKQGAYSEFVKCYSCCVSDAGTCDTTQRCAPGTPVVAGKGGHPAGPDDLHDMCDCFKVARQDIDFIGYSVRSTEWRYTEWLHFNGTILHGDFSRKIAHELYDHRQDDSGAHDWDAWENENVADVAGNAQVVADMHKLLVAGFLVPTCGLPPKPPC